MLGKCKCVPIIVSLAVVFSCWPSFAEEPASKENINPKAKEIITKSMLFLKGVEKYSYKMVTSMKMDSEKMKQDMKIDTTFLFQKPNKFSMRQQASMFSSEIVCDGSQVFINLPSMKKYFVKEAPKTMEELPGSLMPSAGGPDMSKYLLMAQNPDKVWEIITKVAYLGEEEIEGVKYDHITMEMEVGDAEFWYSQGENPLPYKIIPDMKKAFAKMKDNPLGQFNIKMEMIYKDWNMNPDIPTNAFVFTPPEGVEKMEGDFMQGMAAGAGSRSVTDAKKIQSEQLPSDAFEGDTRSAESDMKAISMALSMFRVDNKEFPRPGKNRTINSAQLEIDGQIRNLFDPLAYIASYPADLFNKDGQGYRYFSDGKFFVLVSDGPDGDIDYDERTYKGESIDDLKKYQWDETQKDGDIIMVYQ